MGSSLIQLICISLLLQCSWPLATSAKTNAQSKIWTARQYCQPYGKTQFVCGTKGASISSERGLTIFVPTTGPACVFNTSKRTYCELKGSEARSKFSFATTPGPVTKGGESNILQFKATQYRCDGFNKKGHLAYSSEFWTTRDLNLPPAVTDKYLVLCGLPRGLGMPLRIYRHYDKTMAPELKRLLFLDTYEVKPSLSAKEPVAPCGYRKAVDELEVIMGDEISEFADLLDDKKKIKKQK